MALTKVLQKIREEKGLSPDEAADEVGLAPLEYMDKELGRQGVNIPEAVGILVGLGVPPAKAREIAETPKSFSLGDPSIEAILEAENDDPFVVDDPDFIILVDRRVSSGHPYEVSKSSLTTVENLIEWALHLCEKSWVTTRHLELFLLYGIKCVGINLYGSRK